MSTVSDLADVRDDVVSWRAGDWELACVPKQGGRLLRCDWQGEVIMRRATSDSIWDAAHFPLVPFSNRIAQGHFEIGNRVVTLRPNMPGSDSLHPLHGQGWQSPWTLELMDEGGLELGLAVSAGEWPWAYAARQSFRLHERDLVMTLSLTNEAVEPMPAGLGFHPYFPCTEATVYHGLHRGEWQTSSAGLPVTLVERAGTVDWWRGAPVGTRNVDTVYVGREGPLSLTWPDRALKLTMHPSPALRFTVVYTPPGQEFVCIEPVSHMTDAINRQDHSDNGLIWLAPGESLTVSVILTVQRITTVKRK
jgi:aldose 1-epimerase